MTEKFILWAQALDNISPDHFDVRGEELSDDDSARRQEAVSSVSNVIKHGTCVFEDSGVLLTADNHHFVLEVPSAQRDSACRTAPIVCYGACDAAAGDALVASATVALEYFAKRIGRSLQPEHLNLVRASFEALKKKSLATKLMFAFWIGAICLVFLAVVYWMTQRNG